MSKGTVQVSFAGTLDEARAYAAQHNVNAPSSLAKAGCDGLPMLSLPFANAAQLSKVRALFTELGWEVWAQETRTHRASKNLPQ